MQDRGFSLHFVVLATAPQYKNGRPPVRRYRTRQEIPVMDFETARKNMIENQIRPNRVTEPRLLDAFERTPRERFVPETFKSLAYVDEDIPLGRGRYLMEPMVLARLIAALRPEPDDAALLIGVGTGYAAAILAPLVSAVIAVENDKAFAAEAERNLEALSIGNVAVLEGDLTRGCPEQAPYNVILFDGAIARLPELIEAQLAEGGRLAAVIRRPGDIGRATLITRYRHGFSRRPLFEAATPRLAAFDEEPGFVF
jgi:protein-L-isoaspartate(D-aspartate) O-methyltransferase